MSDTRPGHRIVSIDESMLEQCWQLRLRALHDHPDAFGQPWEKAANLTPDEVRAVFASFWTGGDNQVFVAVAPDGAIAGMTGTFREHSPKEAHIMHVWGVYVAPEHRGLGLARDLLDATIAYCRLVSGVLQVHLGVVSTNTPAVRSYQRAGFVRWGRLPRGYIVDGVALDTDFMVLMLDDDSESAEQPTGGTST